MYYHVNIDNQLKEIFKNARLLNYEQNSGENLEDFVDGEIYKKLIASEDGEFFRQKRAFSFIMNTDGISICTKSKLTIWPFYLAINEIIKEDRFLIQNMVLAGLSVGDEKPNFDVFLHSLVAELKRLEYGIEIQINSSVSKNVKFFLVAGIFDKPAKAAVLNMKASNGFYGCTKCLQPGVTYKDKEKENGKTFL
jgi:hypothetical protein